VAPTLVGRAGINEYARPVAVAADLTFELEAVHGSHVLRVEGLPAGWMVRSIRYRSREVLDIPVELDGDPRSDTVDIQVTRRLAEISGRTVDAAGNAARDARVYVFPADRRRWEGWMRGSAVVAASGAFRVRNLLEGDYLIVAVSASDQAEMNGARLRSDELFSRLAKLADPITLLESDRRVIDLRVTPVPPEWKR
jgi:hypothetical protein